MSDLDLIEERVKEIVEFERMTHEPLCIIPNPFIARLWQATSDPLTLKLLVTLLEIAKRGRNLQRSLKDRGVSPTDSEVRFIEAFADLSEISAALRRRVDRNEDCFDPNEGDR